MTARTGLLAGICAVLLLSGGLPHAAAQEVTDEEATAALAERYAPRVVVREQAEVCGPGEAYQPADVDDILGRDDVTLRPSDGSEQPAPTAQDLATSDADTHLDFPGNPLDPGCDYDEWGKQVSGATPPTLYAKVATDAGHPGQLALQYWFYWVFNDWNNRHEGDWEMIQVVFPAATAAGALAVEPTSVAFAQHEGSETAAWDDPKLRKDGTHPVVYPSEGSHAAYYDQANWFGKSAAAGFGCDNTSVGPGVPGVLWEPEVLVVPDDPDSAFTWLEFEGHWGQQAPSFNNGPTGPNTKRQWTEPIAWQLAEGRDGAVPIPPVPGPAVGAFCTLTTEGSLLFVALLDQPLLVGGLLVAIIVIVVLLVRGTVWRGADASSYDRERRSGRILTASFAIYGRRLAVFAGLGLVFLAGTALTALIRSALLGATDTGDLTDTSGATDPVPSAVVRVLSLAIQGPIVIIVVAAAIAVVAHAPGRVGFAAALRASVAPAHTAVVLAGTYLLITVLAASVLLLPVALWLAARWAAAGPAAMCEHLGVRASLRRSVELTRQRRLRTLALTGLFLLVALGTGPLLGALLLLLTNWSFTLLNGIVAVAYAVLLPWLGIALTLQFYDLRAEQRRDAALAAAGAE
jgi:hypothetical protein